MIEESEEPRALCVHHVSMDESCPFCPSKGRKQAPPIEAPLEPRGPESSRPRAYDPFEE